MDSGIITFFTFSRAHHMVIDLVIHRLIGYLHDHHKFTQLNWSNILDKAAIVLKRDLLMGLE